MFSPTCVNLWLGTIQMVVAFLANRPCVLISRSETECSGPGTVLGQSGLVVWKVFGRPMLCICDCVDGSRCTVEFCWPM